VDHAGLSLASSYQRNAASNLAVTQSVSQVRFSARCTAIFPEFLDRLLEKRTSLPLQGAVFPG
jgi:hypothetical protein